jgi:AraC-like DNA-binding protein/predicted transcriptional regulator YdeE
LREVRDVDFLKIAEAMKYIEAHLEDEVDLDAVARRFFFSPYYFHRVFTAIVGVPLASYIRNRRLLKACALLAATRESVTGIALDCGFSSAQAFSRAFRRAHGMSPGAYRRLGRAPEQETIDGMIVKFTNRLRGGVFVNPRIMKRGALAIAGVSGDGARTGEVWERFMKLIAEVDIPNRLSESGYEVRTYDGDACEVHVGYSVEGDVPPPFTVRSLPASEYAAFDVYVARGYDSENAAMDEWLKTNVRGYRQRLFGGKHVAVEYYDERFNGEAENSIVEIWVPIEKG